MSQKIRLGCIAATLFGMVTFGAVSEIVAQSRHFYSNYPGNFNKSPGTVQKNKSRMQELDSLGNGEEEAASVVE